MNSRRLPVASLIVLLVLLFAGSPAWALCSSAAKTWECWEGTLAPVITSAGAANPYQNVKIKVTFTQGSQVLKTYAFWDKDVTTGADVYRFRMTFPTAGVWNWSATCEAGCNFGVQGLTTTGATSSIQSYVGNNVLYNNGYLKVNKVTPNIDYYLLHSATSKPFFWLGDTAWAGPLKAGRPQWNTYLADRKNDPVSTTDAGKKFTVIQIALPVDWMRQQGVQPTDVSGRAPFDQLCPNPVGDCNIAPLPNQYSRWNRDFWQEFEWRIQKANDEGFVVMIVGLMEGAIEERNNSFCPPLIPDAEIYARNVAARFAGNFVILSPGFDRLPNGSQCGLETVTVGARITQIGNSLKTNFPHLLVTNHWAGSMETSEMAPFHNSPWLDFELFQSGQAGSFARAANCSESVQLQKLTERARTMPLALRGFSPPKPNVNGEAIYDQASLTCNKMDGTTVTLTQNYKPLRARQAGYLSLLSGAVGYTYGVKGIYDWGATVTPSSAWAQRSSTEMRHLHCLFDGLNWKSLTPDHGRIQNQVPDTAQDRKMVLARNVPRTFLVAYLPHDGVNTPANQKIVINFGNNGTTDLLGVPTNGWWFNPRLGAYSLASGTPTATNVYSYTKPLCAAGDTFCASENDWILVLAPSIQPSDTQCPAP